MALPLPLTTTANVTNGSTSVEVVGAILTLLNCAQGAQVFLAGLGYFVASAAPTDTTHFELERPYEGDNADGVTCSIGVFTPAMAQGTALSKQLTDYDARAVLIADNQAGLSYVYSAATVGDPGDGNIAFDNADLTAATLIRLNNADASGQLVTDRLDRWGVGDEITVRATDGGARVTYVVASAPVDETGYRQAGLTYVGKSGALTAGADVVIERIAKGSKGDPGTDGVDGTDGANGVLNGIELDQTANYTLLAADSGKTVIFNSATAVTGSFSAVATLGATWMALIKNVGVGLLTLDPNGSETIDGAATITLATGQSALVASNGTALKSFLMPPGSAAVVAVQLPMITSSTTYVPDAKMLFALVEAFASGGAGGGAQGAVGYSCHGSGGAPGGYSRKWVTRADIGASKPVTIGAAAAGNSGAAGNAGSATSLGTLCVANGGGPGDYTASNHVGAGAIPATAGTGDLAALGGLGGDSFYQSSTDTQHVSGFGGSSLLGGGAPGVTSTIGTGANATGHGSAGGGAATFNAAVSKAGGNSLTGAMIITEFRTA